MKAKRPISHTAVKENEPMIVVELLETGEYQIVESQFNLERAERAVDRLTKHQPDTIFEVVDIRNIEVY